MRGFFHDVYELVGQIPAGKVATYGQIAALLDEPHNARVVGWAMRKVPDDLHHLPCHRVVKKTGDLAPTYAFGGSDIQKSLLENEGVTFDTNGRINMEKHLWAGHRCPSVRRSKR